MKITLIGSTGYQDKMKAYAEELKAQGNTVFIPAFDSHPELDELGICAYNLYLIEQSDEVHMLWDAQSQGTIFDMGMCFALRKPVRIKYLNEKTFTDLFVKYVEFCKFVESTPKEELEAMILEGQAKIVIPGTEVTPTEVN